jgi:hypothetical protein
MCSLCGFENPSLLPHASKADQNSFRRICLFVLLVSLATLNSFNNIEKPNFSIFPHLPVLFHAHGLHFAESHRACANLSGCGILSQAEEFFLDVADDGYVVASSTKVGEMDSLTVW